MAASDESKPYGAIHDFDQLDIAAMRVQQRTDFIQCVVNTSIQVERMQPMKQKHVGHEFIAAKTLDDAPSRIAAVRSNFHHSIDRLSMKLHDGLQEFNGLCRTLHLFDQSFNLPDAILQRVHRSLSDTEHWRMDGLENFAVAKEHVHTAGQTRI